MSLAKVIMNQIFSFSQKIERKNKNYNKIAEQTSITLMLYRKE
jgi:hypothetical protein